MGYQRRVHGGSLFKSSRMMSAKVFCLLLIAVVFPATEARLRRPGISKSGKPSTALAEALDLDASYTWNYCQVASLVWAYVKKHNLAKIRGTFNTDAKLKPLFKKELVMRREVQSVITKNLQ